MANSHRTFVDLDDAKAWHSKMEKMLHGEFAPQSKSRLRTNPMPEEYVVERTIIDGRGVYRISRIGDEPLHVYTTGGHPVYAICRDGTRLVLEPAPKP